MLDFSNSVQVNIIFNVKLFFFVVGAECRSLKCIEFVNTHDVLLLKSGVSV